MSIEERVVPHRGLTHREFVEYLSLKAEVEQLRADTAYYQQRHYDKMQDSWTDGLITGIVGAVFAVLSLWGLLSLF